MKQPKYCVTFAGAVGSSKSPIAYYLSDRFNLPIFSNDTIKTEVTEDNLVFSGDEYERRKKKRLEKLLEEGKSFIYDASIDRKWSELKDYLEKHNYRWFVISMDLDKGFLTKLYGVKGYYESLMRIDRLISEHVAFLDEFEADVNRHISNDEFPRRLGLSELALKEWLTEHNIS